MARVFWAATVNCLYLYKYLVFLFLFWSVLRLYFNYAINRSDATAVFIETVYDFHLTQSMLPNPATLCPIGLLLTKIPISCEQGHFLASSYSSETNHLQKEVCYFLVPKLGYFYIYQQHYTQKTFLVVLYARLCNFCGFKFHMPSAVSVARMLNHSIDDSV